MASIVPAFDRIFAALFHYVLRQHSQMTHEWNALSNDGAHLRKNFPTAFRFYEFSSSRYETTRICDGLLRRFVAAIGQIASEQCLRFRSGGGTHVMLDLLHGHVRRIRITEHDHAERIPYE